MGAAGLFSPLVFSPEPSKHSTPANHDQSRRGNRPFRSKPDAQQKQTQEAHDEPTRGETEARLDPTGT